MREEKNQFPHGRQRHAVSTVARSRRLAVAAKHGHARRLPRVGRDALGADVAAAPVSFRRATGSAAAPRRAARGGTRPVRQLVLDRSQPRRDPDQRVRLGHDDAFLVAHRPRRLRTVPGAIRAARTRSGPGRYDALRPGGHRGALPRRRYARPRRAPGLRPARGRAAVAAPLAVAGGVRPVRHVGRARGRRLDPRPTERHLLGARPTIPGAARGAGRTDSRPRAARSLPADRRRPGAAASTARERRRRVDQRWRPGGHRGPPGRHRPDPDQPCRRELRGGRALRPRSEAGPARLHQRDAQRGRVHGQRGFPVDRI